MSVTKDFILAGDVFRLRLNERVEKQFLIVVLLPFFPALLAPLCAARQDQRGAFYTPDGEPERIRKRERKERRRAPANAHKTSDMCVLGSALWISYVYSTVQSIPKMVMQRWSVFCMNHVDEEEDCKSLSANFLTFLGSF